MELRDVTAHGAAAASTSETPGNPEDSKCPWW
jgi:hypothetical protein